MDLRSVARSALDPALRRRQNQQRQQTTGRTATKVIQLQRCVMDEAENCGFRKVPMRSTCSVLQQQPSLLFIRIDICLPAQSQWNSMLHVNARDEPHPLVNYVSTDARAHVSLALHRATRRFEAGHDVRGCTVRWNRQRPALRGIAAWSGVLDPKRKFPAKAAAAVKWFTTSRFAAVVTPTATQRLPYLAIMLYVTWNAHEPERR